MKSKSKVMHFGLLKGNYWYQRSVKCGTFILNVEAHQTRNWAKVTCKRCLRSHKKDLNICEVKIRHLCLQKNESYCGIDFSHYDAKLLKAKLLNQREGVSCKRCKSSFKSRDVKVKKVHFLRRRTFFKTKIAFCGFEYDPTRKTGHKLNFDVTTDLKKVTCKRCIQLVKLTLLEKC